MEFQLSYFKFWKMMLRKCYTQYASKLGKLSSGHRTGKVQFSFPSQRKAMPEYSNYHTNALSSQAGKVMLKILQARLWQYMNHELPDVQPGFRKGRGPRDWIANILWIIKKEREFQRKTCISALLTMPKHLTVWITINWKILKEMEIADLTCPLRNLYAGQEATVRTGHGTMTSSK